MKFIIKIMFLFCRNVNICFFFNYYLKGTLNATVFIIFINDVKNSLKIPKR